MTTLGCILVYLQCTPRVSCAGRRVRTATVGTVTMTSLHVISPNVPGRVRAVWRGCAALLRPWDRGDGCAAVSVGTLQNLTSAWLLPHFVDKRALDEIASYSEFRREAPPPRDSAKVCDIVPAHNFVSSSAFAAPGARVLQLCCLFRFMDWVLAHVVPR